MMAEQQPLSPTTLALVTLNMSRDDLARHTTQMRDFLQTSAAPSLHVFQHHTTTSADRPSLDMVLQRSEKRRKDSKRERKLAPNPADATFSESSVQPAYPSSSSYTLRPVSVHSTSDVSVLADPDASSRPSSVCSSLAYQQDVFYSRPASTAPSASTSARSLRRSTSFSSQASARRDPFDDASEDAASELSSSNLDRPSFSSRGISHSHSGPLAANSGSLDNRSAPLASSSPTRQITNARTPIKRPLNARPPQIVIPSASSPVAHFANSSSSPTAYDQHASSPTDPRTPFRPHLMAPLGKGFQGIPMSSPAPFSSSPVGEASLPFRLPTGPRLTSKPHYSYAALIGQALMSSPVGRLSLNQIYTWISLAYPYFKRGEAGWQNSIRHNLSLNGCFVKIRRDDGEKGKGSWWAIREGDESCFAGGGFQRQGRANGRKRKGKEEETNAQDQLSQAMNPSAQQDSQPLSAGEDSDNDGASPKKKRKPSTAKRASPKKQAKNQTQPYPTQAQLAGSTAYYALSYPPVMLDKGASQEETKAAPNVPPRYLNPAQLPRTGYPPPGSGQGYPPPGGSSQHILSLMGGLDILGYPASLAAVQAAHAAVQGTHKSPEGPKLRSLIPDEYTSSGQEDDDDDDDDDAPPLIRDTKDQPLSVSRPASPLSHRNRSDSPPALMFSRHSSAHEDPKQEDMEVDTLDDPAAREGSMPRLIDSNASERTPTITNGGLMLGMPFEVVSSSKNSPTSDEPGMTASTSGFSTTSMTSSTYSSATGSLASASSSSSLTSALQPGFEFQPTPSPTSAKGESDAIAVKPEPEDDDDHPMADRGFSRFSNLYGDEDVASRHGIFSSSPISASRTQYGINRSRSRPPMAGSGRFAPPGSGASRAPSIAGATDLLSRVLESKALKKSTTTKTSGNGMFSRPTASRDFTFPRPTTPPPKDSTFSKAKTPGRYGGGLFPRPATPDKGTRPRTPPSKSAARRMGQGDDPDADSAAHKLNADDVAAASTLASLSPQRTPVSHAAFHMSPAAPPSSDLHHYKSSLLPPASPLRTPARGGSVRDPSTGGLFTPSGRLPYDYYDYLGDGTNLADDLDKTFGSRGRGAVEGSSRMAFTPRTPATPITGGLFAPTNLYQSPSLPSPGWRRY